MRRTSRTPRNAGFTVIEVMIGIAIMALILVNIHLVSKSSTEAVRSGALRSSLNDELELTLDRITFALMAAQDEEIEGPLAAPLSSGFVRFATVLGRDAEGGVVVGSTEQISWLSHEAAAMGELDPGIGGDGESGGGESSGSAPGHVRQGGRVSWIEDSNTPGGRRVTWSNDVPVMYRGEVGGNGLDDNSNELLDESGLAFSRSGAQVEVFLTVERPNERGENVPIARSLKIAPRN